MTEPAKQQRGGGQQQLLGGANAGHGLAWISLEFLCPPPQGYLPHAVVVSERWAVRRPRCTGRSGRLAWASVLISRGERVCVHRRR
jgi:hypothetical protein